MFNTILPFIKEFIEQLEQGLQEYKPGRKLSKAQRRWLSFSLRGVLWSNQRCWNVFERNGLGGYKPAALSWMFRQSKLLWEVLLHVGITLVLKRYGIKEGVLSGDDTDRPRAKVTKRIFRAYKVFDKKTGGYFNGQTVVLLLLNSSKVSLPVGFRFYQPDPAISQWKKNDERLNKSGVKASRRPPKPRPNAAYPSKPELMLALLKEFKHYHPLLKIKAILVDALYGQGEFMNRAATLFDPIQTVSQLQKSQIVYFRNQRMSVAQYFAKYPGVEMTLKIRGFQEVQIQLGSARLYVKAHGQKRFIVALKYAKEEDYRYLIASDMGWRAVDIATVYTLRWLIEVFFEDWKLHEGWGPFAPQFDEEGSSRGLILSLLLDYALLLHPEQLARVDNPLPACTVGSLRQQSKLDALVALIRGLVEAQNPHEKLDHLVAIAKQLFPLRDSAKHMSGRDWGRLEPTPSLKYRANACLS